MTLEERVEWVKDEFDVEISCGTLSRYYKLADLKYAKPSYHWSTVLSQEELQKQQK